MAPRAGAATEGTCRDRTRLVRRRCAVGVDTGNGKEAMAYHADLELARDLVRDVVPLDVARGAESWIRIRTVRGLRLDKLDARRPPARGPEHQRSVGSVGFVARP